MHFHQGRAAQGCDVKRASFGGSILRLIQADITTLEVDAIVNAANASLVGGGGVDGAIHRAGGPQIMKECRAIGRCPTGGAVITSGGNLKARHVIHAVAPRWHGQPRDAELLASAYATSLKLADEHGVCTIAFPSLGTGAYGYPVGEAARIALSVVANHLRGATRIEEVTFALFSQADLDVYASVLDTMQ
jgi:O-acetyl-ADP-ribose deacetylase (regulator of RNase III)